MTDTRFPFAELEPATDRRVRELWGRRPINLYRILANHPRILAAWTEWNNDLRHGCSLPRALRETIFLRSAHLHDSSYEWTQHSRMARDAGLDDVKIAALKASTDANVFDELERILVEATDEITGGRLTDQTFTQLCGSLSSAEVIEVIVTASHAAMLARVIQALGVSDAGEAIY